MTKLLQFYGEPGVPLRVGGSTDELVAAWSGHRARLRDWFADLPEAGWRQPTRCSAWDVQALIPVIERAGGMITTWDGKGAHEGGSVIATGDPVLHDRVMQALAQT